MTHLKLLVEYDGTEFSGWQSQPNGRTVQDVIESALRHVTGEQVRVAGGGRTDAGVHAEGQVASLTLSGAFAPAEIRHALNGVLPDDVVIREASLVPAEFHARFSALERSYRYSLVRSPTALKRRTHWAVGWKLNASYLESSAASVLGRHDFGAFAKVGSEVRSRVCSVRESVWTVEDDEYVYRISSDRFLYGMVRALVGTMVEIARGYRSPADMERILATCDRSQAGMAAPARGLCLTHISYE